MNTHFMELPQYVVIGSGLENVILERLRHNGYSKCLMITSRTPFRLYGSRIIGESGGGFDFDVFYLDDVLENMERSIEKARAFNVVLAVGGGRVVDVCKVIGEQAGRPFFSIPTVASHDGIASPMTSFRRNGKAYSKKSIMPQEVFADMDVISLAPRKYLLSGCGDLVAKQSAVRDWWLAHRITGEYYGRYAAHLAYLSSTIVLKSARLISNNDSEGVRTVVEALISAGVAMGVAGSSRPCSGSEHLIAHALENMMDKPALHGERCGVASIFTSYIQRGNWRKIRDGLLLMGAANKLKDINVDEELFTLAVETAPKLRPERYTILNHVKISRKMVSEILHETGLI